MSFQVFASSLLSMPGITAMITGAGLSLIASVILVHFVRKNSFDKGVSSTSNEITFLTKENETLINGLEELQGQFSDVKAELAGTIARAEQIPILNHETIQLRNDLGRAREENRELATRLEEQKTQAEEKLKLLEDAKVSLSNQFQALANQILEEKSKKFTDQNQTNLTNLVSPIKQQLQEFERKFLEGQNKDIEGRTEIKSEIGQLRILNQQISIEAENLTKALKGDSKIQGAWGELILEKVLENSGLVKGREYDVQKGLKTEGSGSPRPDVVVHLPDNKDVVIDSKVSLTAYERFHASNDTAKEKIALAEHVNSIRSHIKRLSEKSYQSIDSIQTLDFVLMFVPVEAALTDALREAPELFEQALSQNIGLVSPSSMMLTLRTIEHIWRSDRQNKNAQEIATRGGALYDKFVGFAVDLEKIGSRIRQTQDAYHDAKNKLSSGQGNLVRQAELLKVLGAKTTKSLPSSIASENELRLVEVQNSE